MDSGRVAEDAGLAKKPTYEIEHNEEKKLPPIISPKQRKSVVYDKELPLISDENPIVLSPEDIPDEYEYVKNIREPGLLVVFNFEEFRVLGSRHGTNKDVENLIDCFSRLRFEVRTDLIHHDLKKDEVEQELQRIAAMDHSSRNSLTVIFLTHGDTDGKLHCSDDLCLTSEEVWTSFTPSKCPTLKGKPKIFIFQACKGSLKTKQAGVEEDSFRIRAAKETYKLPEEADVLVAYSTYEGRVSYRHTENGSWYIQELCKNLTAFARREDILSILTRVSKCVAYHYIHCEYKQMPCILSTLTSKFYLCRSKEREMFMNVVGEQRNLAQRMENVEKALQVLQEAQQVDKNDNKLLKDSEKQNRKNKVPVKSKKPAWKF